jgi:hypothetical protein
MQTQDRRRGNWTGGKAAWPTCPGCDRPMTFSQPDDSEPDQLLGSCDNLPACGEWVVFVRREDRWIPARRISSEERRNPTWPVARPTTRATARR